MPALPINIVHIVFDQNGPMFADFIELLTDHLQQLGCSVRYSANNFLSNHLNIIVGHIAFLPPDYFLKIQENPAPYAVFQLETLKEQVGVALERPAYIDFLLHSPFIWDYSLGNLAFLEARGYKQAQHVPIGYSKRLERVVHAEDKDIDVLFYGSLTPRRLRILEALRTQGVNVEALYGAFGRTRDQAIGRAKIVLNIHQDVMPHLEMVRLSYLLNNRAFVISETADGNPFQSGVAFANYDLLPDTCVQYLRPEMRVSRGQVAEIGYIAVENLPTQMALQHALENVISGLGKSQKTLG